MAQDIEAARAYVKQWQVTGELLDQIKWEELRAMTEEDAVQMLDLLNWPEDVPLWRAPDRENAEGMIEQQRLFARGYELSSHR
jgi:hypothetical protein